jgi:hypothetical protein
MNGPAPGWQPDPTGRHEYRYWDGTKWSDDVSDGGVTANDPVGGGAPDATQQQFDQTQPGPATTPQPTYQAGYDPSGYDTSGQAPGYGSGGYGATGGSAMGGTPLGGAPSSYGGSGGSGSGGYPGYGVPPAQQPGSSGPSTGLLVGLGVLVLVLIGGIAFVLLGKDDDDGGDTATGETTTTTAGGDPGTTAPETTDPPDDGGDGSNDAIVDAIGQGILEGSGGVLNEEEANCMAAAMVDEIGVDRLVELGLEASDGSSDPLDVLTTDEQDAVFNAMLGCVDAGTLAELPSAPGG